MEPDLGRAAVLRGGLHRAGAARFERQDIGVIGHFSIGGSGKGDLLLAPDASQLSVLEGKIFSRLSPGVANARYFDQAARNVACAAEVLHRAGRDPEQLDHLSFHVVAPVTELDASLGRGLADFYGACLDVN